jgi:hypothetical protein
MHDAIVTYDAGHTLRVKGVEAGRIALDGFLAKNATSCEMTSCELRLWEGPSFDKTVAKQVRDAAKVFGRSSQGTSIGDDIGRRWKVKPTDYAKLCDLVLSFPKPAVTPNWEKEQVWVFVRWKFDLVDPKTKKAFLNLGRQHYQKRAIDFYAEKYLGESWVMARQGDRNDLVCFLSVPLSGNDPRLQPYIDKLQMTFPAKFLPKSWREHTPNKTRTHYNARRLFK